MPWFVGMPIVGVLAIVNYMAMPGTSVAHFVAFMSAFGAGVVSAATHWSANRT